MQVEGFFKKQFGYTPPHVVEAPGRLELLGNHTDHNEGLVLSVAIDRNVGMAAAARQDSRIHLVSSAFPEKEIFGCSDVNKNPAAPWADYVKGVLVQLQHRGVPFSGFDAAIHSTIPMGAGLSSSAAIEVATVLTVRRLFPFAFTNSGNLAIPARPLQTGALPALTTWEKLEIAKLCQAAENEFAGVHSGLLDQISCMFGQAFHAVAIDFQSLAVEHTPLAGDLALVVCDSGVKHELTGGEYNELRRLCDSAAHKLGAKTLRSVDLKSLAAKPSKLTDREYQCACHVAGEIQRVALAKRALWEGDYAQFGQYMFQSHESSRDFLRNSIPELDLLVELARHHPACFGARLTGGGFGGATINLVRRPAMKKFAEHITQQWVERTGRRLKPMICQVADGAA